MDLEDIYEFANLNPICYLATAEGKQPRVRPFTMWYAGDKGFYFFTSTQKDVYKQLRINPRCEICFYATQSGVMLRASGETEFIDDIKVKSKLLDKQPYIKQIVDGPEDPTLAIFRVQNGEAYFWTIADNGKEDQAPRFKF
jgi:pyridoxamine 5'-phosphate oxidase